MANKKELRKRKSIQMALDRTLKKVRRYGGIVYVACDVGKGRVDWSIDPKRFNWRKRKKKVLRGILNMLTVYNRAEVSFSIVDASEYEEYCSLVITPEQLETAISYPNDVRVLRAMLDQQEFGEAGGKSFRAISKDVDRIWFKGTWGITDKTMIRDIPRGLKKLVRDGLMRLVESDVVVQSSMTGTFWVKSQYRDKMRELGISFLPTTDIKRGKR